ncbi:uncharacterized protein DUF885 [Metamycoplasma subdolum]|uniref:Uncharacterized protein DUF885 n=1 Tax=Metamycoplasma subdolum TaxID=92407 RepID=A0A3M0A3X6_9BACT|nr:DUF885 family protein [Metamycoplasma subdolum]RMA77448.1 uncharacterized protein DUF885 [Metamycoplasma subdolum]WPB50323.1 DUF885 family protein [Metamycoplasma subdolum]
MKKSKIWLSLLPTSLLLSTPLMAISCNCEGKKPPTPSPEDKKNFDNLVTGTLKDRADLVTSLATIKDLEAKIAAHQDEEANKAKLEEEKKKKEELEKKIADAETQFSDAKYTNLIADYILATRDGLAKKVEEKKFTDLYWPSKETSTAYAEILDGVIKELSVFGKAKINSDLLAWINGLSYNWEIEKGNHLNGLAYLFASFEWGPSNTYAGNSFYGNIVLTKAASDNAGITMIDPEDAKVQEAKAKGWLARMKEAIDQNLVVSKIHIKNNMKVVLQELYGKKLLEFAEDSGKTEISVKDLIGLTTKPETEWTAVDWINKFYTEYATTYYNASTFGKGEDLAELKLFKTNSISEKENTIVVTKKDKTQVSIYGLGLTQKDLEQKNAGIAYIPGKSGGITGKQIYNQLLKMVTTSDLTPKEVFDKGHNSTTKAKDNMIKVAEEAAKLIVGETGEWKETIKYDDDGVGANPKNDIEVIIRKADGKIDYDAFVKWLNAEDFFFGREEASYYSSEIKDELKTSEKLKFGRTELTKYGYDILLEASMKDKAYGSITNEQFWFGAMEAFKAYKQFKDSTQSFGKKFFGKEIVDFEIDTYKYTERDFQGVGAYNFSSKKFQFNVDPYYSLPKWSVTSFANHESMMGHHNQLAYASQHLAQVNGKSLGASTFDYTAYTEGWALFMEWFGIEAGYYGTPNYESTDVYAAPKDFSLSKGGITNFFTTTDESKITAEMIDQIKKLHGGVYWTKVNSKSKYTEEKKQALAAVKLTNLLQYFGALNEAQLRNMRLAVDTAIHGEGAGNTELSVGASIKDVRQYMTKNSALGIGDITSESKRYFNCAGQATSYNSGKEVMLDLYQQVYTKLGLTREQFINAKTTGTSGSEVEHARIHEFFDYLLRNSALPMQTLVTVIKAAYDIK